MNNTFKNFFWFLYKPADEREQGIYYKARMRQLSFIFVLAIIAFLTYDYLIPTSLIDKIVPGTMVTFFFFLMITSYIAGWTSLRKEELNFIATCTSRPHPYIFTLIILLLTILNVIVYFLYPEYKLYVQEIMGVSWSLVFIIHSYLSLKGLPSDSRVITSLFFAPILFMLGKYTKNGKYQLGKTVLLSLPIFFSGILILSFGVASVMLINSFREHKVEILSADNTYSLKAEGQKVRLNCSIMDKYQVSWYRLQNQDAYGVSQVILFYNNISDKRMGYRLALEDGLEIGTIVDKNGNNLKVETCNNKLVDVNVEDKNIVGDLIDESLFTQ